MAIADMFAEAPQAAMQPPMAPAPAPMPAQTSAPAPMAQRSFTAFAQAKQNDPANWVTLTNQGAVRNLPIVEALQKNLQSAIATVYGPGYRAQVYSGGQPALGSGGARVGSTRHDGGMAADLYVLDPQGNRVTGDKLAGLGRHWLENRLGGVGLEMRGGGIHLDMHQGRAPVWTYGPVSPAQAALVREFGGSAVAQGPRPVGQSGPVPMMARAGTPQPAMPGAAPVPEMPPLMAAPGVGLASLFTLENQRRIDEARQAKEEAVRERRRLLFSGPGPFG